MHGLVNSRSKLIVWIYFSLFKHKKMELLEENRDSDCEFVDYFSSEWCDEEHLFLLNSYVFSKMK